jgi:hypothetical protein
MTLRQGVVTTDVLSIEVRYMDARELPSFVVEHSTIILGGKVERDNELGLSFLAGKSKTTVSTPASDRGLVFVVDFFLGGNENIGKLLVRSGPGVDDEVRDDFCT